MPTNIKDLVEVTINTVPRLSQDVIGNEWPEHAHSEHTRLSADDHLQYMLCSAGASRPFTGDVYFEEDCRIVAESSLMFDDHWRDVHALGGGDWSLEGINLSDSQSEWQDFYDTFGEVSLLAALVLAEGEFTAHAPTHITGGTDEIDGDKLDIDWNPTYYTPATTPTEATSVDNLTAHLYGIDQAINTVATTVNSDLDDCYRYPTAGAGRSITADNGAVQVVVPDTANNFALDLLQNDTTNNPDVMQITNSGSGHAIYIGGSDKIGVGGALLLDVGGALQLDDGNRAASTWAQTYIPLSDDSGDWDDWDSAFGEVSLMAGVVAAASNLGQPDGQIAYGAGGGTSLSSEAGLTWDATNNYLQVYETAESDYMRLSHDGSYAKIDTSGEPISLGGEVSNHGLAANGDIVVRKLEVNNRAYFDEYILLTDDKPMRYGAVGDSEMQWGTAQTNDAFMHGISGSYNYLFVDLAYIDDDFAVAASSDPTMFFFASTDPSVDNTQYGSIGHTGSQFRIASETGAVGIPANSTSTALSLSNATTGNTSEVLGITNSATLSTGHAIYLQGAAGGGGTDYDAVGHKIWTPGSMTIGHGAGSSTTLRESYLWLKYDDESASEWAEAVLVAEAQDPLSAYARVWSRAGLYGGTLSGKVYIEASNDIQMAAGAFITIGTTSGDINLNAGAALDVSAASADIETTSNIHLNSGADLRFDDVNRTGSTWAQAYMLLSDDTDDWDDFETAFGEVSLMGAIVQAASAGGVSEPAGQLVYGTGTGVDSSANMVYTSGSDYLTIGVSYLDFDETELRDIGAASFERTSTDVTSTDAYTINPDNAPSQFIEIDDDTELDLTAPTGGTTRTSFTVYNSDTSDHVLDFATGASGVIQFHVHAAESDIVTVTDGSSTGNYNVEVTCVAGEWTEIVLMYEYNDGSYDHWKLAATTLTDVAVKYEAV